MKAICNTTIRKYVNWFLPFYFFAFLPLSALAQDDFTPVHGDCLPDGFTESAVGQKTDAMGRRKLPTPRQDWNPEKVYRQLVILVEQLADSSNYLEFSYTEDAHAFYDKVFNEQGFNAGNGPGCVADYYRDQSQGMLNLQFDVYGPVKVDILAQPYQNPSSSTRNYGRDAFIEATNQVIDQHPEIDFSVYDWNGNRKIEQVIFVYAGLPGNIGTNYGYIWPNTSSFTTITTPDNYKISNYTASGELWPTKSKNSCGVGTICHEFSHSLGLPDIYPTVSSAGYSVCDEWDLMDGGNFTNYGWCPCNFTPMEKWVLGWISFVDLEEPATITDLKPVAEGGVVYRIKHTDSEWLLLENRQQRGWDAGAPGKGLVIYHVDYDASKWQNNTLNNDAAKRRFELIHADNMDYDAWTSHMTAHSLSSYAVSPRMNKLHLSTSPYPWTTDSTEFVNDELTETSVPAPKMNNQIGQNTLLQNKSITNICMSEEGLISFDFMGGDQTGISNLTPNPSPLTSQTYDLQGRRVSGSSGWGILIQRRADGTIRKYLNKLYIY